MYRQRRNGPDFAANEKAAMKDSKTELAGLISYHSNK